MLFNTAVTLLDWFGVVVFAVSGARRFSQADGHCRLRAARVATGIGGGTLRRRAKTAAGAAAHRRSGPHGDFKPGRSRATVVGRGVSLWIAVQSLSQLDAVYGKTRASVAPRQHGEPNLLSSLQPADRRLSGALPALGEGRNHAHLQTVRDGAKTSQGLEQAPVHYWGTDSR